MRSLRDRLNGIHAVAEVRAPATNTRPDLTSLGSFELQSTQYGDIPFIEKRTLISNSDIPARALITRTVGLLAGEENLHADYSDLLFLDTETNGLSGGIGTQAFLVGLGFIEHNAFVVRQYLMSRFEEERALLEAVSQHMNQHSVLVTFNGKSFDWPVLLNRYILHGFRPDFKHIHLDLLHPARRLWRRRLLSCSLGTIEREIFKIDREGDIPGFLIPQVYFDFIRSGDAKPMKLVLNHNQYDVELMGQLVNLLSLAIETSGDSLLHPVEQFGLGTLLIDRGEITSGIHAVESAIAALNVNDPFYTEGCLLLARYLKRHGRKSDATGYWNRLIRAGSPRHRSIEPFIELSKFYEHDVRDYEMALAIVERARLFSELWGSRQSEAELRHRRARLMRKRDKRRGQEFS